MPREYERIRDALLRKGMSEEKAKRLAAAKYVGGGKTPRERRARAKRLREE